MQKSKRKGRKKHIYVTPNMVKNINFQTNNKKISDRQQIKNTF